MAEALILTIASGLPEDREALQGILLRIFPKALTAWINGGPQISIPLADIREEAPDLSATQSLNQQMLANLLYVTINGADEQFADVLWRIHRGDGTESDRHMLAKAGMVYYQRTPKEGPAETWLGIAYGHPAVQAIYATTRWADNPFNHLRRIPGAERAILGVGCRRQHIIIPMDVVTALVPEVPY